MSGLPIPPPSNPTKSESSSDDEPNVSTSTSSLSRRQPSSTGAATFFDSLTNFLSSPPSSSTQSQTLTGIKNDLAELTGSFKNSLSFISSRSPVTGLSKFASAFFQEGDEIKQEEKQERVENAIVQYVEEMSQRPQLWTDFPIPLDHLQSNEFKMSDMHREHISNIEQQVPRLVPLRHDNCSNMSEEQFWMIYFVLLLPRLTDHVYRLLVTPEIVETRNTLLQTLQKKEKATVDAVNLETADSSQGYSDCGKILGNSPTKVKFQPAFVKIFDREEDTSMGAQKLYGNEDGISFTNPEEYEDDKFARVLGFSPTPGVGNSSHEDSEWVQLKSSDALRSPQVKDCEGEEANDWYTVDDFD